MDAKDDHVRADNSEAGTEGRSSEETSIVIASETAPPLQAKAEDAAADLQALAATPASEPIETAGPHDPGPRFYVEAPMFVATPDQRAAPQAPDHRAYDWTSVYTVPDADPQLVEEQRAPEAAPAKSRFWLLAACIAVAASLGAAAGAAGFAGIVKLASPAPKPAPVRLAAPPPAPLHRADLAEETRTLKEALGHVRGSVRSVSDSLTTLKSNVESSGRSSSAQIAKLADLLSKLNEAVERLERSQAEPAARLVKMNEMLERLDRRAAALGAAPEPTGSVRGVATAPLPAAVAAAPAAAIDSHGAKAPVVEGWVVRRVYEGVALVEGRNGVAEVEPGDNIRGVGRVQEIKRQDGQWMVVTSRGVILSR